MPATAIAEWAPDDPVFSPERIEAEFTLHQPRWWLIDSIDVS